MPTVNVNPFVPFLQLKECDDLEDEAGGVISEFESNRKQELLYQVLFY